MSPRRPVRLLLVLGGILLLTNPVWVFPHEGDTKYTYERSTIRVENGTLTYSGAAAPEFAERNSLTAVGCESYDDEQPRACAFDRHLVTRGPVTVSGSPRRDVSPEFVRLDGGYYRRIHRVNRSGRVDTGLYDVERVTPQTVLVESAVNLSGDTNGYTQELPLRVAITGDSVRSFEELDEAQLGRIYRSNGSFYTVVVTDERSIDHGLTVLRYELPRYILMGVGGLALGGAIVGYLRDRN